MARSAEEFRAGLVGAIAFPITPFHADLSLDADGLRRNVRVLAEHRFAAIVAAGGTGEMYSLTPAEHGEVVRATVDEAKGRVPVVAGVGFNTTIAGEMARAAGDAGADAILALPPYYPNADDEGLLEYYAAIGRTTPLPLLVYSRDWVNPSPAWVEKAGARIPTLVAWKDGQGDARRLQQIMARVGRRLHWIGGAGDDCVPAYYALGLRAYTSSIATVAPKLSLKLHEVAAAGDAAALRRLMETCVIPLYALRSRRRGYEVTAMKELMNALGLAAGPVRPPLPDMTAQDKADLRPILEAWKPFL